MLKFINKMKNKKGFTLVELIIVLAVLGIIAAIAVPRFTRVQDQARYDADIATGRTLAKATEMYIATQPSNVDKVTQSDLVDADLLDCVSTPQAIKGSFEIEVNSNKITVKVKRDGNSNSIEVYPDSSAYRP